MQTISKEWGFKDPDYALEKLRLAFANFSECDGTMADRLYEAYFQLHLLNEEDFPPHFRRAFNAIIVSMTHRADPTPDGQQGRVGDAWNTLKGMPDQECLRIAARLRTLLRNIENSVNGQPGQGKGSRKSLRSPASP